MFGLTLFSRMSFLPYRAKSAEDFVQIVKKEGCQDVTTKLHVSLGYDIKVTSCGVTGTFVCLTQFISRMRNGRPILYKTSLSSLRFFSVEKEGVKNAKLELIETGIMEVNKMKQKLPNVSFVVNVQ